MPWHLSNEHEDCNGWAVVKDSTDEVIPGGCHKTKADAMAHMAALVMNEDGNQMDSEQRVGRVLSTKNESKLREAMQAIVDVLAQLGADEDSRVAVGHMERRTVPMGDIEIREVEGKPVIGGYAAVFNRLSMPLMGFREQIKPGAFAGGLDGDIRALWQHDTAVVLGRTKSGTLKLWEDKHGLAFELIPPDTQAGRDAMVLIGRGDVDQMSFGFVVPRGGDTWDDDGDKEMLRTLNKVELIEISPVTFPAYPDTTAIVRALESAPENVQRALTARAIHIDAEQARARDRLLKQVRLIQIQRKR